MSEKLSLTTKIRSKTIIAPCADLANYATYVVLRGWSTWQVACEA